MPEESTLYLKRLERQVEVFSRLMEISAQLNATWQIDKLLSYIMDAAADIANCDAASVLLWNHASQELFIAATTTNTKIDIIGQSVPLQGSIAGTVMVERRIIQVDEVYKDPRHYQKMDEEHSFVTRSLLGLPMTVKDKAIGVLEVLNKRVLPWTDEDHYYLSILAGHAAIAIESTQLVNELRKAHDELSNLDKLKNDFIAIASHELRTPLGVILGYASFLQEEVGGNQTSQEHVQIVINSALKLRKIIVDLTNLRYIQQQKTDLQLSVQSVSELLVEIYTEVEALATSKHLKFAIQKPRDHWRVRVDRGRMVMAITNIVVNAIEFSHEGQMITIETQQIAENEIRIGIRDQGIGIPTDQLERIFERFYQLENHMIRHHEGLGIGLSITRGFVEAHGGRVWAHSEGEGTGATFYVLLPLFVG